MIKKHFDRIEKADIEALVANAVGENRMLDYKEALPGGVDADKREFLADVSAFANASGGDLIFGIREQRDADNKPTGVPESVCGLPSVNVDAEKLRLENILRDGLDPRVPGIQVRAINGFEGGPVMLFHIPKSWASPHMIKASWRFYSRHSSGKYPLDVREIRAAFAISETLPEKIRRFRDDRLAKIVAIETPIALASGAKIVLQLLPIAAFDPTTTLDLAGIKEPSTLLKPIGTSGWDHRFNFDGFLTFAQPRDSAQGFAYTQLFRNGAIEAVNVYLLSPSSGKEGIPSIAFEEALISSLKDYLKAARTLNFQPPLFVLLTFLGVKGFTMITGSSMPWEHPPIDRDVLLLPEAIIEDFDAKPEHILRPAFDCVWQAAGWHGSLNYDEDGNWKAHA